MTRKSVTNFGRVMAIAIVWISLVSATGDSWAQQPGGGFRVIDVPAEVVDPISRRQEAAIG
jgi:hypothetical protein